MCDAKLIASYLTYFVMYVLLRSIFDLSWTVATSVNGQYVVLVLIGELILKY